jgi:glycosyltransferase involved in cell wall biosynthesis
VFLEAMSCGLPCIGSTVDAMPELIEDGTTGYVVAPGDAEALAERMTRVISDPALAKRLGSAGAERLRARFTWPDVGRRILESVRLHVHGRR